MGYLHEKRKNFEDFSSGRVLYNQPGTTSFPARLASEVFLRCKEYLNSKGRQGPFTLLDPCCGGAYMLTMLGFLHGKDIKRIVASDIDENVIQLANKNLGLLTKGGLENRKNQLKKLYEAYQKNSHHEAIISAEKLWKIVESQPTPEILCTKEDILNMREKNDSPKIDMVITDVPYGNLVKWSKNEINLSEKFMSNLRTIIANDSVVAIVSNKNQKFESSVFKRIKKFKVGLRQISILTPNN